MIKKMAKYRSYAFVIFGFVFVFLLVFFFVFLERIQNNVSVILVFRERIYLKYNRKKVLPYNHQNKKQFEVCITMLSIDACLDCEYSVW